MTEARRKRPFYLILALLAAAAFGGYGALQGWDEFLQYRGAVDPTLIGQNVANAADRAALVSGETACLAALEADKAWGWPMAVGAIVLGSAVFVFAMRGLARNSAARAMLVQLVVVQAGLNGAQHWLLRNVFEAKIDLSVAAETAYFRVNVPEWTDPEVRARAWGSMARAAYPFSLVLETLGSGLIVLALTRRRARESFEPSGEALGER